MASAEKTLEENSKMWKQIRDGEEREILVHQNACKQFHLDLRDVENQLSALEKQKKNAISDFIKENAKYTVGQRLDITFPNDENEIIEITKVDLAYNFDASCYEVCYFYKRIYNNKRRKSHEFKLFHSTAIKSVIKQI